MVRSIWLISRAQSCVYRSIVNGDTESRKTLRQLLVGFDLTKITPFCAVEWVLLFIVFQRLPGNALLPGKRRYFLR